jgi:Cu/Ag efflux protein CusF
MLRQCLAIISLFALSIVIVNADEVRGKVKKVDTGKNAITITNSDDKDQTFDVPKDAKIVGLFGKKLKKAQIEDLPGGLTAIKEGASVTVFTEPKDGKQVVSQVKLNDLQKKKKK